MILFFRRTKTFSFLSFMVTWITFNMEPFNTKVSLWRKRFFTLKSGSFMNCSLKGSLRNQRWFFYGTVQKPSFGFFFLGLSSVLDTTDFHFADKQNKGYFFNRFSISYCYNNHKNDILVRNIRKDLDYTEQKHEPPHPLFPWHRFSFLSHILFSLTKHTPLKSCHNRQA